MSVLMRMSSMTVCPETSTSGRMLVQSSSGASFGRLPPCRRRVLPARHAVTPEHVNAAAALLQHAHIHAQQLHTIAAATAAAPTAGQSSGGWLAPISDGLESVLRYLQTGLKAAHVPYSYGYSIMLLTLLVKIVTYPLTKQQVESAMAVQTLKPRIELIKARYGDDKDKVSKETSRLYKQAGVNPLAGCLPSLATIPIFWGLYRSLTNVASAGDLNAEGFYWITSLAGPTTVAARASGAGTQWLFPLVDGAPPIGWHDASLYLVLPVLLVVAQYISSSIISPPVDPNEESNTTQKVILGLLPLMVGWFALNVPSGLGLYYLANTVLTGAQQVYLRKLGGATVTMNALPPVRKVGSGRRVGEVAQGEAPWVPQYALAAAAGSDSTVVAADADITIASTTPAPAGQSVGNGAGQSSFRCKRKRLVTSATTSV